MANFVSKKLQVFVSSTFTDLIAERQAAVSAILSAGHIPAGMELFTAGDESQMDVIKRWIDESDVFLLILGGRYGSIEPASGKSYTHLEYEYAASQNKPLFACVIQESTINKRAKAKGTSVVETLNGIKLAEFRTQVLTKLCRLWDDPKDIKISVIETLATLARRQELIGWVRATAQTDVAALVNELARLSNENAKLRTESTRGNETSLFLGLNFSELKALLENSGALKSLIRHQNELVQGSGFYPLNSGVQLSHLDELKARGLIQSSGSKYFLTSQGQMFLNRNDYEIFNRQIDTD